MSLHDLPTSAELLEAVREWMERDVMSATEGRLQFHTRVAINVLAIVQREIELGAGQAVAQAARLHALGCNDEADLATKIRDGSFDDRLDEVRALVRESVVDKLRVANPKYLDARDLDARDVDARDVNPADAS